MEREEIIKRLARVVEEYLRRLEELEGARLEECYAVQGDPLAEARAIAKYAGLERGLWAEFGEELAKVLDVVDLSPEDDDMLRLGKKYSNGKKYVAYCYIPERRLILAETV